MSGEPKVLDLDTKLDALRRSIASSTRLVDDCKAPSAWRAQARADIDTFNGVIEDLYRAAGQRTDGPERSTRTNVVRQRQMILDRLQVSATERIESVALLLAVSRDCARNLLRGLATDGKVVRTRDGYRLPSNEELYPAQNASN